MANLDGGQAGFDVGELLLARGALFFEISQALFVRRQLLIQLCELDEQGRGR